MYIQAANVYRIQKDGRSAGQAFEKAAEVQQKCSAKDEAASTLVEAFKSYKQTDPEDAVRVLKQSIELFTLRGQFRRAANYEMDLGGIYETELHDAIEAIKAYDTAGEWYFQDQAEALANKAFLKVADLAALNQDYEKAISRYEQVAKGSLSNSLTKWSLKDYFLKAGLCHLAEQDIVAAERAVSQYLDWDPSFATTRECLLLQDVIECVKESDTEALSSKLMEYDQFSKLDNWKATILLKIKNDIVNQEDDLL